MKSLPSHVEERFFRTMKGDITVHDFEQWLYSEKEIEHILNCDDYFQLISLNYKTAGAKYDLWKVLSRHVDLAKYETFKLLVLLEEARLRTPQLPCLLESFYDLYCCGYSFLEDLGLRYGLVVSSPMIVGGTHDDWEKLSIAEQQRILAEFYPGLDRVLERMIAWLREGTIVLTGDTDEIGHYGFVDNRTIEQRRSAFPDGSSKGSGNARPIKSEYFSKEPSPRNWWRFWR